MERGGRQGELRWRMRQGKELGLGRWVARVLGRVIVVGVRDAVGVPAFPIAGGLAGWGATTRTAGGDATDGGTGGWVGTDPGDCDMGGWSEGVK